MYKSPFYPADGNIVPLIDVWETRMIAPYTEPLVFLSPFYGCGKFGAEVHTHQMDIYVMFGSLKMR